MLSTCAMAQCPLIPESDADDHTMTLCEGDMLTMSATGENLPLGSTIDWYVTEGTENPYDGEGVFIGSSLVTDPNGMEVEDFVWTVPDDFCETFTGSGYAVVGITNPPPVFPCLEVLTPYYGFEVGCGSIELTGGGDVCEGDCPEAPTEMIFTVSGNDAPYTVDIEVSATLFGTFPINGLQISNGEVIYVCLEGFFPSFDPASGILNIPVLAIGFMASVEIVSATTSSGCPITLDQNSITLHFIEAPTASVGSDQTICAGETVSVSGSIGGSAETSMWSTGGDGTFANPNALSTVYTPGDGDIANGQVVITLFSMDENGSCIPGEASLTVFINPSLLIDVNSPLTICDNDMAAIMAIVTGSSAPCMWETDGDGVFDDADAESTIYTPGFFDILNGSVTLYYNPLDPDACVESNEPLVLTLVAAPEVDIPQNLEVCEGDSVVIEIDINGDFSLVTWSYPGDGVLVIEDDFNVTYTPGPMDIDDQFFIVSVTVQSAFSECGEITYNIPVYVIFCDCPDFEIDPPASPLCSVSDTLDLSTLFVVGGSGAWSITTVPAGSNPAELIGTSFITDLSDPGMYTVTYTLNFPEPGCPVSQSETVTVINASIPEAGNDMAFCGYQSVQVTGAVMPPTTQPIEWVTVGDGFFDDPSSLSTVYNLGSSDSMAAQIKLVLVVLDTICGSASDTVTMYFNQPPVTTFVNDTVSVCNTPENGSVINFESLIIGGDTSGTWSNPSNVPVDFTRPDSVNFIGLAEGFYAFQYETNAAMSPCSETVYVIIVQVEECMCPLLMIQNFPQGICNTQPSVALDAFIQAGAPGTWAIFSTPPGINPGTIAGSMMVIDGCDPGLYSLRFTFDAAPIDGCPDSAEISLLVQEPALISLSNDTAICGQGNIQVESIISGSATGVAWTTNGSGLFNDTTLLNPVYTISASDVANGQVLLIASALDTFGFCPSPIDTILLAMQSPPFTSFSTMTDTICIHPDSVSVINLISHIVAGDAAGSWSDLDGAGVNLGDPSSVDFISVPPGNYRIGYQTQSAMAPCVDSLYVFTVVVLDCGCPALDISDQILMYCMGDTIDLDAQIINAAPGAWDIYSGPTGVWPVINGSILLTESAAGGNYLVTYTLTDSIPDCPASATIDLLLETTPDFSITTISCDADHIIYEVIIETDGTSVISDFGIVSDLGVDGFSIDSVVSGQDVQITIFGATGMCSTTFTVTAPDCDCTLTLEDIADTLRFCPGDTFVLIPFVTGAQGLPFSTWITPYGTFMQPTLPLYREGTYIWIVRDMAGCEERDTFVFEFTYLGLIEYTISPPVCPDAGGSFVLDKINGMPPYVIAFDGGAGVIVDTLPYFIGDVSVGGHNIFIMDATGCSANEFVQMYNFWDFGTLELGEDQTIPLGDSVFIEPFSEGISISSVTWNPPFPGLGLENFWFRPEMTTLLSVAVEDTFGCVYADEILISVYEEETFYIPNIFSPNNDGINDVFEIVTNLPPEQLLSLEIFDRWGSKLYGQYGITPYQWDGLSNGKRVQSGVYVYKFSWKDAAGDTRVEIGDITLLR